MNALLWSLSPKRGRQETALMLRTLPGLLARLQEGCAALGVPAPERDALFGRLAMLHAAVAREGLHADPSMESEAVEQLEVAAAQAVALDFANLPPPSHDDGAILAQDDDAEPAPLSRLTIGSRVVLRVGAEDKMMALNWVSPMGGMYLFTNKHGLDALTLTRARLAAKFREGEAKLLA